MKTKIKKLMALLVVFSAMSCAKNDDSPEPAPETFKVSGKVLDESNNPVSGATILFEDQSTTTNATGEFSISADKTPEVRKFITINSNNKFEAYRAFSSDGITEINLQIIMMNKGTVVNFNSVNGVNVTNSGGSVAIAPNSIQKENGEIYSGQVTASVRMLNTNTPNFEQLMQGGDFAGVNNSNQSGSLKSYGFYAAELEDPSGNKLNLKTGTTASFNLPIAANDVSTAPQTVKLWHFDKTKAIWVENGTANKVNGKYVGTVPHFSEWNCDDWYTSTTVSGPWYEVASSYCNGGFDVVYYNSTTTESIIVYNMPTASSGTFYFTNAVNSLQSCQLYALYIPSGSNASNVFYSVPSQASGWLKKTGTKSFTMSCTLTNDYSNPNNPSTVRGFNGGGSY